MIYNILSLFKVVFACFLLSWACITDIRARRIPNLCPVLLVTGRAVFLLPEFFLSPDEMWTLLADGFLALFLCLVFFLMLHALSRGGIGMGDVKLFSALGFLFDTEFLLHTVFLSFLFFACVSAGLLISKKKRREDTLPFAPFILAGFLGTVFWLFLL